MYSFKTVQKWCTLIDPFPTNHCSFFFFYTCSFSCASILMIFPDQFQMKSFKDINILIKVKLFCLKNLFFLEKTFIWKKLCFWKLKYAFERKKTKLLYIWSKKISFENFFIFGKKTTFFGKTTFERCFEKTRGKKKISLLVPKSLVPKSSGA